MYIMYSNDLPTQLKHMKIQMYADDVQLFIGCNLSTISSCVSKINADLLRVSDWAAGNGLILNPKKSKCVPICRTQMETLYQLRIVLGNSQIEIVSSAKNLGIIFNSTLSWTDNINNATGKTYGMLRTLWINHYFTPLKIRMLLAKSYLLPTLLYGCELFCGCSASEKRKLRTAFNNITRYVFNLRRTDSVSQFAKKLFNVSFDNLLKCRSLIFLHKIIYTKEPDYLFKKLIFARSTRGKVILHIRYHYQTSERQFFIHAVRLWNLLPHNIQSTSNAVHFKRAIFNFFD